MIKLTTPAAEEPVDLAQLKAHLHGVSEVDDDADLTLKLTAAREYIEGEECRGRALITSTWALTLAAWPCRPYIEVPLGNLQSATITYRCSDGTVKPWASTEYRLERVYTTGASDCGIGRIYLGYGKSWPSDTLDVGEPITITFVCGWQNAASVPFSLRAAILLVAATLYRNRESVIVGNAATVSAALKLSGEQGTVAALCGRYADRRF